MAILDVTYTSALMNRSVQLKVILPIEYTNTIDTQKEPKPTRFKTLYLLHGYSGNYNDWTYHSRIFKLARDNNLAVVMPNGENSFYIDSPVTHLPYGKYIGEEIVTLTRSMFPLSPKREDTYIAGLSMGGFGSLILGSRYCETFSKIASLSGGFILEDIVSYTSTFITKQKKQAYETLFGPIDTLLRPDNPVNPLVHVQNALKKNHMPEVFLACGLEDALYPCNEAMRESLKKMGVPLTWQASKGDHSWEFWDQSIETVVNWLLSD